LPSLIKTSDGTISFIASPQTALPLVESFDPFATDDLFFSRINYLLDSPLLTSYNGDDGGGRGLWVYGVSNTGYFQYDNLAPALNTFSATPYYNPSDGLIYTAQQVRAGANVTIQFYTYGPIAYDDQLYTGSLTLAGSVTQNLSVSAGATGSWNMVRFDGGPFDGLIGYRFQWNLTGSPTSPTNFYIAVLDGGTVTVYQQYQELNGDPFDGMAVQGNYVYDGSDYTAISTDNPDNLYLVKFNLTAVGAAFDFSVEEITFDDTFLEAEKYYLRSLGTTPDFWAYLEPPSGSGWTDYVAVKIDFANNTYEKYVIEGGDAQSIAFLDDNLRMAFSPSDNSLFLTSGISPPTIYSYYGLGASPFVDTRAPIEIGQVNILPCWSPCLPYAIKRNNR
jgi:hypothetical protein